MNPKASYEFEIVVIPVHQQEKALEVLKELHDIYAPTGFINPSAPDGETSELVRLLADFYITAKYNANGTLRIEEAAEVHQGPVIEALDALAPYLQEGCIFYEYLPKMPPTRFRVSLGQLMEGTPQYAGRDL